jgi:hypothetical protein
MHGWNDDDDDHHHQRNMEKTHSITFLHNSLRGFPPTCVELFFRRNTLDFTTFALLEYIVMNTE